MLTFSDHLALHQLLLSKRQLWIWICSLLLSWVAILLAYHIGRKQIKLAALQNNINTLTQEIWNANAHRMYLSDKYQEAHDTIGFSSEVVRAIQAQIDDLDSQTKIYIKQRNKAIDEYNNEIEKFI